MIVFAALIRSRQLSYAVFPDAPRGYLAGEQDPEGDLGIGLLTVNSAPAAREIEVRHRRTRRLVATTFSRPDGTWQVPDLPSMDEYDIIARDHAGVYEDVIIGAQLPYVPE